MDRTGRGLWVEGTIDHHGKRYVLPKTRCAPLSDSDVPSTPLSGGMTDDVIGVLSEIIEAYPFVESRIRGRELLKVLASRPIRLLGEMDIDVIVVEHFLDVRYAKPMPPVERAGVVARAVLTHIQKLNDEGGRG